MSDVLLVLLILFMVMVPVRGDGALTYGRVFAAMDAARGAGAERIGILAPQS